MARPATTIESVQAALDRLHHAVAAGQSRTRCLRRWSEMVRERDDHRCVDCHSTRNLSAHHICRKVFLPEAEFQTGNGITLCRDCHVGLHRGFNGRPDTTEPMDAQGGEKLRQMERLYCILDQDAVERDRLQPGFYDLSEQVLAKFKLFMGFDPDTVFPGPPVRQAYLIWAQTSLSVRRAIAAANGAPMTDGPILPGEAYIVIGGDAGEQVGMTIKDPRWY
ncbi:MAG: hypothetical protein Q8N10_06800 [Phenylobacterium sp.]|uniref:HNH endonuclease n=1 Tax=Phenylobacterium sp. TaxID=1871053 RepID=UPI00271F7706|nr:hypothetical protein [Phenylobacterium sp.]MDO8912206.1 hypothetical protein [Phenylobacterium sp.]MDP2012319.1 hypothetical protein [Phenylobacterium sp.]MDP3100191.1 hypothetical protein [Phenylobacterium sp.]